MADLKALYELLKKGNPNCENHRWDTLEFHDNDTENFIYITEGYGVDVSISVVDNKYKMSWSARSSLDECNEDRPEDRGWDTFTEASYGVFAHLHDTSWNEGDH